MKKTGKNKQEPRETFVGLRPAIFDTRKQNPQKIRREGKLQIRKYMG